jgi:hypothetical protein
MTFSSLAAPAVLVLASLCLIWFIGYRISDRREMQRFRRQLDLASVEAFYKLYGEFFAVWKLWDAALRFPGSVPSQADHRRDLLLRATVAEGSLEALLVKVTSERRLTPEQQKDLGRFRQGFQTLRQAIREDKSLSWLGSEDPEYVRFKSLALAVASTLSPSPGLPPPEAFNALSQVTATGFAGEWRKPAARRVDRTPGAAARV